MARASFFSTLACLALSVGCGDNEGSTGDDVPSEHDAATGDAADPGDGGPGDGAPPDGDTAGVTCGDVTCEPGMDCCVAQGGGGSTCVAAGTCEGNTFACDDVGDCATAGDVCCHGNNGSECVPSDQCETPTCVTDEDCTDPQNDMCCAFGDVMVCAPNCPGP